MKRYNKIQQSVAQHDVEIMLKVGAKSVREWLKNLRGDRSSAEIAEKLGMTQQYYNYIENGKRQMNMDLQLCVKLSKIFDISVEQIIEYEKQDGE